MRDYQGRTQVNEDIQKSLREKGQEDFWWLNNGVTILATNALQHSNKVLTIERPQIVNGQQTSTEIFNFFKTTNDEIEDRCLLLRVIVASDSQSQDRIIKAINSQNVIPPASLRATEKIHRNIEEYLAPFQIYYDRRKNSQKQLGRPTNKIISISLMAQAVMAIVLWRPDHARARPSTLIKKDADYPLLFSENYPIKLYLVVATIVKKIHSKLRSSDIVTPKDRTNLLFYVAAYLASILTRNAEPSSDQIAAIDLNQITDQILETSINLVNVLYKELGANDQVAKGNQFVEKLKQELMEYFERTQLTQEYLS